MRWGRGLFRLWCVLSLLWLLLVAAIMRPDEDIERLWSMRDLPTSERRPVAYNRETGEAVRLEANEWVPTETRPDDDGNILVFDGKDWRLLAAYESAPVIEDDGTPSQVMKSQLLVKADEIRSKMKSDLIEFGGVAGIPPLGMLVVGMGLFWAVRGFRQD